MNAGAPARQPTLVYLLPEDWVFRSHFRDRARAARNAGYRVVVMARESAAAAELRAEGFAVTGIGFRRRRLNPLAELGVLREIARGFRRERPALVHNIALKPILYGTLAARLCGIRAIVNAPIGMGFVFTSARASARLLRPLVNLALRVLLNPRGSKVVLENPEDLADLIARGFVRREDGLLIPGAGVDLKAFAPHPEPPGPPVVVLAARLVASKGVHEFVAAARLLKKKGVVARFQLAGDLDPDGSESMTAGELAALTRDGTIEWPGHRDDMPAVYAAAHIACLPSYREGLPKALLEAAAAGVPVVTTDVVGCRFAVRDGETGLLVPARDAMALADALERLIGDPDLRRRFGAAGRARAEALFGTDTIADQTLALYRDMTDQASS